MRQIHVRARGGVITLLGAGLLFSIAAGNEPALAQPVSKQLQRYEFAERHMGTLFRLLFYAPNQSAANTAARAAFDRLAPIWNRALRRVQGNDTRAHGCPRHHADRSA